jgi:hypothetical protein
VKSPQERFIEIAELYAAGAQKQSSPFRPKELLFLLEQSGLFVEVDTQRLGPAPEPQNPQSWFCPHCGNDRPQYTVLINNPVQMIGVGIIQTATLVCLGKLPGKDSEGGDLFCRRVLSAQVVNLQLDNALLADPRRKSPLAI